MAFVTNPWKIVAAKCYKRCTPQSVIQIRDDGVIRGKLAYITGEMRYIVSLSQLGFYSNCLCKCIDSGHWHLSKHHGLCRIKSHLLFRKSHALMLLRIISDFVGSRITANTVLWRRLELTTNALVRNSLKCILFFNKKSSGCIPPDITFPLLWILHLKRKGSTFLLKGALSCQYHLYNKMLWMSWFYKLYLWAYNI